jgi:hypothetical protein
MSITAFAMAATIPVQGGWYSRPGVPRGERPVRVIGHETDNGFCSVCGAVWPCARARREQRLPADPFNGTGRADPASGVTPEAGTDDSDA